MLITPDERTVVFIDSGHLRILLNRVGLGGKICLHRLSSKLACPGSFLHGYYYDCIVHGQNERFLDRVAHLPGMTVRLGKLHTHGQNGGRVEKEVDVQLAVDVTDIVATEGRVQTVVLLTADADFIPVVTHAQSRGVRVIIAHAPAGLYRNLGISDRLVSAADGEIILDRDYLLDTVRPELTAEVDQLVRPPARVLLPEPTRVVNRGEETYVDDGEIADVYTCAKATVGDGGIAIARQGSTIHALKGATIYLCADDVSFTGTRGFRIIPAA